MNQCLIRGWKDDFKHHTVQVNEKINTGIFYFADASHSHTSLLENG